jgi:hypothetical protein
MFTVQYFSCMYAWNRHLVVICSCHFRYADPTYTTSGQRDIAKAHYASMRSQVEQVPVFTNFFSEAQNFPRAELRYKASKHGSQMPVYQENVHAAPVPASVVLGSDRPKYFRRPMVPFLNSVPPEVLFAPSRGGGRREEAPLETGPPPKSRTVEIQTDYRESDAQTDPYTPDYIIHPNAPEPEVLSLTSLSYGKGLPATLEEVAIIERARDRKAFECVTPFQYFYGWLLASE